MIVNAALPSCEEPMSFEPRPNRTALAQQTDLPPAGGPACAGLHMAPTTPLYKYNATLRSYRTTGISKSGKQQYKGTTGTSPLLDHQAGQLQDGSYCSKGVGAMFSSTLSSIRLQRTCAVQQHSTSWGVLWICGVLLQWTVLL